MVKPIILASSQPLVPQATTTPEVTLVQLANRVVVLVLRVLAPTALVVMDQNTSTPTLQVI